MGSRMHSPCLGYLSTTLFILSISLNIIGVGTPPQPHKVLVDTGSSEIWVNCAGCLNCRFDNGGVHIPPYDPSLSTTARIFNFTEDHCGEVVNGSRCRFVTDYVLGRGMEGYIMEDKFLIGNPLIGQSISTKIRFGCVTKHNYTKYSDGYDFFGLGIDGIIGFGDFSHSLVKQFNRTGIRSNQLAHCLDNINGGGVFVIGNVMEPKVPTVDQWDRGYDLALMDIDFGGAKVALNGSSIALFDSGSDEFFIPDFTFQDINGKFEAFLTQKNGVCKKRVNGGTCFQLPGKTLTLEWVDQEFPNITLHFSGSMLFNVTPHNYIRPVTDEGADLEGFWCLFVSSVLDWQWGEYHVFVVGSSFMSDKLMVFDNVNTKVGFVDHDCSIPIQVEGKDGKPVSLGPQIGN